MKAVPERTGGKAMPVRTGGIQSAGWRRLGGEGGLPPEGPASAGPRIMPPPWLMRPSVKATHCGLWAVSASPSPGSVLASGLRQSDSEGLAPTRTSMPTQENRPPTLEGLHFQPLNSPHCGRYCLSSRSGSSHSDPGPSTRLRRELGPESRLDLGSRGPGQVLAPRGCRSFPRRCLATASSLSLLPPSAGGGHGEVGAMFQDPSHENGLRIPLFLAPELHIPVSSTPGAKAPINIRSHQPSHS